MIKIVQVERRTMTDMTSWCKMCYSMSAEVSKDICDTCLGFLSTSITCPNCMEVEQYNGLASPDTCKACKYNFPDLNEIKESKKARVDYYIGEVL